jgi:hypothetical protein
MSTAKPPKEMMEYMELGDKKFSKKEVKRVKKEYP